MEIKYKVLIFILLLSLSDGVYEMMNGTYGETILGRLFYGTLACVFSLIRYRLIWFIIEKQLWKECESMKSVKVAIGELIFEVLMVDADNEHLKTEDDSVYSAGVTVYHDLKIYIDKTMAKTLIEKTLIHEITHAYLFAYGMVNVFDEEELCDFVSNNVREIMRLYNFVYNALIDQIE